MVYHFPGTEPIGNSSQLRFIRLLTSDEQAASVLRAALKTALGYFLVILFGAALLRCYQDYISSSFIPTWTNQLQGNSGSWSIELSIASSLAVIWACKYSVFLCRKWHQRIKFEAPNSKAFFWATDDEGNPQVETFEPGAFGVILDKKRSGWFPYPTITVEYALKRSFQTVGLQLLPYLWMDVVAGTEYSFIAALRMFGHYCGLQQYNQHTDRHQIYLGMINTSCGVYMNATPGDTDFGHIVIKNCLLPHENGTKTQFYSSIVFHLDHAQQAVLCCVATSTNPDGTERVETYGDPASANNTYEFLQMSEEEQVHQIGLIALAVIATHSHAFLHWWSNAPTLLKTDDWPSVHVANTSTQWVNGLAVFGSPNGTGFTEHLTAKFLCNNADQGYPSHNKLTIVQDGCVYNVGLLSKFHQMSHKTRVALAKFMNDTKVEQTYQKVDGIIATTIMHSADHYYTSKYFPTFSPGSCVLTKTDMSGINMAFIKPIAYWSWRSLVRQNLSDPINRIIYEVCLNEDPDFAYSWLSLGCTT